MSKAHEQFISNIKSLHNLSMSYDVLNDGKNPLIDLSEILRAEVVLAVSALDCYIHDISRATMIKIFQKKSFSNINSFKIFPISLGVIHDIINASTEEERMFFVDREILKNNSYKSFQEPEKISAALSLIGIKNLRNKVGLKSSTPSEDIRDTLSLIIDRRNKIVHEGDINPELGIGEKYSIDSDMVKHIILFIEEICGAIDSVIETETKYLDTL